MEKLLLRSLIAAAFMTAVGCAKEKEETLETTNVAPVVIISGKVQATSSNSIEGTGVIRFSQEAPNASTSALIDLKASLPNSGSSVSLVTHSADKLLNSGVVITFNRSGNLVTGWIQVGNNPTSRILDSRLSQQLPNSLAMTIEVRNNGNSPRILMWAFNPKTRDDKDAFFDSFQANQIDRALPLEQGTGTMSGLRLIDAEVTYARPF